MRRQVTTTSFTPRNGKRYRAAGALRRAHQARATRRGTPRPGYERLVGYYGRFTRGATTELKFHDLDIDDAVIATGGVIAEDSCNGIAQGVTESQRIGRKCTIKSIGWRFKLNLPSDTGFSTSGDIVRVILYLDRQCNGATATTLGILETADFQSFNNLANKNRFLTLMDRTYSLNSTAAAGNGTTNITTTWIMNDSFYKKCNIPVEFDSTTGAITEVRSNNIGVLLVCEDGEAGFTSKMRLRFSDN